MTTPPALFVAAHPDDETLGWGVTLVEHLAASPAQDIHVLFATDGQASEALDMLNGVLLSPWWGVPHDPEAEGYAPLTPDDLAVARIGEAFTALDAMASGLPGALTVHRAALPDGGVTVAAIQAEILALCDEIAPGAPVRLKGHTDSAALEGHPDHRAVGAAIRALSVADPARFSDRRHYVMPGNWSDPDLASVPHAWDTPTNAAIAARAVNACRAYGAWAPCAGSFAIGYHSVPSWFATVTANPRCLVLT